MKKYIHTRLSRALLLALAAVLALGLAACGAADSDPNDAAPSVSPEPAGDTAADSVTFTDDLGRQVTVSRSPQRVVPLIGSFAHVWQLAGGTMVATANDAWTQFDLGLDESVVDLGTTREISLELLLAAEPDFIIGSPNTDIDVELMPTFEEMGIPAAYFDVNDFAEYLHMLDLCTQITGRRDLYEQNGLSVQEQIDAAIARAEAADSHPTVLYLRASGSSVKAKGGEGTVLGNMLTDLGCVNIADSDTSLLEDLSIERIIADDPERIFIVLQGNDEEKVRARLAADLTDNPAWAGLTAVQEGRLYFMDQKLYNLKPNDRWGEAYEGLADILFG